MPAMRAKLRVTSVVHNEDCNQDRLSAIAVTSSPFDADGLNEDNTYAKYTPSASLEMTIANPALVGKFRAGQVFYLDFTEAAG
jgi:hypothetical protein